MQQNICSPAKDIKTFTLTDSQACDETTLENNLVTVQTIHQAMKANK